MSETPAESEGRERSAENEAAFPIFHPVMDQLEDADPAIRQAACWTLGQLRYGPGGRRLARMLARDQDGLVRLAAAQALSLIDGSAAAQALIRGLRDEDDAVRDACILGLGRMGDTQGLFPLEEMLRRLRDPDPELEGLLNWSIGKLGTVDEPGTVPDRRRGGVSKKISRYLEKIHADPRDGIAHNNLAVAYFHAAEYELAVRHCLLAKELGARVQWLWKQLVEADRDPGAAALSEEDHRFLASPDGEFRDGAADDPVRPEVAGVRLQPEPAPVDLRAAAGKGRPAPRSRSSRGRTEESAKAPIRPFRAGSWDDRLPDGAVRREGAEGPSEDEGQEASRRRTPRKRRRGRGKRRTK